MLWLPHILRRLSYLTEIQDRCMYVLPDMHFTADALVQFQKPHYR